MISRIILTLPLLFFVALSSPHRGDWIGAAARAQLNEKQVTQAATANAIPAQLSDVGITEHLGDSILTQDLVFKNEKGEDVHLASYFQKGKPVVLALAYYECPNLCTLVLNGLVDSIRSLKWTPGKDFEIVTVSIDPRETPALAAEKKTAYIDSLLKADAGAAESAGPDAGQNARVASEGAAPSAVGAHSRSDLEKGWHFLTGQEPQIRALAKLVGFGYKWDPEEKQFAHGAVVYALTPDGRISRYLYGITYQSKDLKLALLEASSGKIGNVIERFMLFCYRYDQKTRKYSIYLENLMRAGSAGTMVIFGGYLAVFWRRQRRQSLTSPESSESPKSDSSPPTDHKEPGSHV